MKYTMHLTWCLFVQSLALIATTTSLPAADSDWDYPAGGRRGTSESSAGRAGDFRSFSLTTEDPIEKAALWYAEKFGIPEDSPLIEAARTGFSNLEQSLHIRTGTGHDTNDRQDYTMIVATLTPNVSHVTFLHRPDFTGRNDVTVSLTTSAGLTSIIVIMPVGGELHNTEGERGGAGPPSTGPESE